MGAGGIVSLSLESLPEGKIQDKELESKHGHVVLQKVLGAGGWTCHFGSIDLPQKGTVLSHRDGWSLWHEFSVSVWRKWPCVCIMDG